MTSISFSHRTGGNIRTSTWKLCKDQAWFYPKPSVVLPET